jgi:hypothetical protein
MALTFLCLIIGKIGEPFRQGFSYLASTGSDKCIRFFAEPHSKMGSTQKMAMLRKEPIALNRSPMDFESEVVYRA